MNGKTKFLNAMNASWGRRLCDCNRSLRNKYLGNRWPVVSSAPDPTLIIWKNLGKGKIERCCRNMMILLAAFALLGLGFLTIVKIYEVNDDFKN